MKILNRLEIVLKSNTNNKYNACLAPLLQGAMYELIDTEYVEELHNSNLHPFSQFVTVNDNKIKWVINCLDEKSYINLIGCIRERNDIYIKHNKDLFSFISKKEEYISIDDLFEKYYRGNNLNILHITFITPTSFKQNGKYVIKPDLRLFFRSILDKYGTLVQKADVYVEDMIKDILDNVEVIKYDFRSTGFYMKRTRIPSFIGNVTLKINGPNEMVNTICYLLKFAEYSGVGVKTGMGMGAIKVN